MQMSELMMSSPHNFSYILITEMMKMPYFSYEKEELALYIPILNKCRIMQMSELMMSSPHNFSYILITEMMKIPYFSYEKEKLALYIPILNKCRIMFALVYFNMGTCLYMFLFCFGGVQILYTKYMENCEALRSSTHSFAFI